MTTRMMRDGLAWQAEQLLRAEVAGETITYSRGATSVEVSAFYGRKLLKLSDKFDSRLVFSDFDVCVSVAEIEAAFTAVSDTFEAPQKGDLVSAEFEDGTFTHQVGAPGSEPPFQRDAYHLLYLIHTQRIQ